MMSQKIFSPQEVQALIDLIEFHDDWEELSEQLGCNVELLHDKVASLNEIND